MVIGLDDQLKIGCIAQADLQVNRSDAETLSSKISGPNCVAIVAIIQQIHFTLEMTRIDGVRRFSLIGTIGLERPQERTWGGVEQGVLGLFVCFGQGTSIFREELGAGREAQQSAQGEG